MDFTPVLACLSDHKTWRRLRPQVWVSGEGHSHCLCSVDSHSCTLSRSVDRVTVGEVVCSLRTEQVGEQSCRRLQWSSSSSAQVKVQRRALCLPQVQRAQCPTTTAHLDRHSPSQEVAVEGCTCWHTNRPLFSFCPIAECSITESPSLFQQCLSLSLLFLLPTTFFPSSVCSTLCVPVAATTSSSILQHTQLLVPFSLPCDGEGRQVRLGQPYCMAVEGAAV